MRRQRERKNDMANSADILYLSVLRIHFLNAFASYLSRISGYAIPFCQPSSRQRIKNRSKFLCRFIGSSTGSNTWSDTERSFLLWKKPADGKINYWKLQTKSQYSAFIRP